MLLLALADFADERGECWPSIETLADRARVTERHVRRLLRELEDAGELVCFTNAGPHGCNRYRIVCLAGDIMTTLCPLCDAKVSIDETEDHHVIPRAEGGTDRKANRLRVCAPCHRNVLHDEKCRLTEIGIMLRDHGIDAARKGREDILSAGRGGPLTLTPESIPPDPGVSQTTTNHQEPPLGAKLKDNELRLEAGKFVVWFLDLLTKTGAPPPKMTTSMMAAWGDAYEKLIRIDGRTKEQIVDVCRWARRDSFWAGNFMSPSKLRQKNRDQVFYYDVFLNKLTHDKSSPRATSRGFEQTVSYAGVTDK